MKIDRRLSAPVLAVCLSIVCVALAQQPVSRGITPEDYYAFEFVTDPSSFCPRRQSTN